MKVNCISSLLLVLVGFVAAQSTPSQIFSSLPGCSVDCLSTAFASIPNAFSNPISTCSNVTLRSSLFTCVQSRCNYTQQSEAANTIEQLCQGVPIQSRVKAVVATVLVCGVVALFAIALRILSRIKIARCLQWDDWLSIATGMIVVPLIILETYNGLVNGYGRHYWNLDPLRISTLFQGINAPMTIYAITTALVKVSILALYFRVLQSQRSRITVGILIFVVFSSGLTFACAIIFQCSPIGAAWDKTMQHRCLNLNELISVQGSISAVIDVIILVLPLPELYHSQMNTKKQFGLLFMFSLGLIACMISTIRLVYLFTISKSTDPTWDYAISTICSFIELSILIICSCLPAIYNLFFRPSQPISISTNPNTDPTKSTLPPWSDPDKPTLPPWSDKKPLPNVSAAVMLRNFYTRPTKREARLRSATNPQSSDFSQIFGTGKEFQNVDLSGNEVVGSRRSMSAMRSSSPQVWINSKYDRRGSGLYTYPRQDDDEPKDEHKNVEASVTTQTEPKQQEEKTVVVTETEDSAGAVWIVEEQKENDDHWETRSEMRDSVDQPLWRGSTETTISAGGTRKFGKVRGGRKRERFMAKVQSLIPLPVGAKGRVRSSGEEMREYRDS